MRRIQFSVLCTLLLLFPLIASAQGIEGISVEQKDKPYYGAFVDFNRNQHSADFRTLPGVPNCCPRFESGSGSGFSGGLLYGLPITDAFFLDFRAGYSSLDATLTKRETTTVAQDGVDVPAIFEHTVQASLGTIGIEPLAGYRLFSGLSVRAGARAGFVLSKNYNQKESLIEPAGRGTFENGQRTRNVLSGEIPEASSIMLSALAGLNYELPLSADGSLVAAPEALFAYGLTPIVKGMDWNANSFRFGLGVRYTPKDSPPEPKPEPAIVETPKPVEKPVEKPREPVLAASLKVYAVTGDRGEQEIKQLQIEEFINTQMHPLLSYIFFDENSAVLQPKYRRLSPQETQSFLVEKLFDYRTLELYYDMLNIIGRRLTDNPKSSITLTGCNSNIGIELNNKELSKSRAESVKAYLVESWGIPESRIKIVTRNLPENPSNSTDIDGIVENRRVEITSESWQVMQPILTTDTLRQPIPSIIRFRPEVTAEAGLRDWMIAADQSGKQIHTTSGNGTIGQQLDWNLEDERGALLKTLNQIDYKLTATDSRGMSVSTVAPPLPVEQITLKRKHEENRTDTIVARYSLILFEFNNGDLNRNNKRITDFVKERILPDATVNIVGYTDRTGNDDYNRQLSEARAEATASALGVKRASVKGLGKSVLLYDNSLPEGRFYCRTVTITVTTPTKK